MPSKKTRARCTRPGPLRSRRSARIQKSANRLCATNRCVSRFSPGWPVDPMQAEKSSFCAHAKEPRQFNCGYCRALTIICRSCDRGHVCCSRTRARNARMDSRRACNARNQRTPRGRMKHANRQRGYRARLRSKVTDHTSVTPSTTPTLERGAAISDLSGVVQRPERELNEFRFETTPSPTHYPAQTAPASVDTRSSIALPVRDFELSEFSVGSEQAPLASTDEHRRSQAPEISQGIGKPTRPVVLCCCVCGRPLGSSGLRSDFGRRRASNRRRSGSDTRVQGPRSRIS